MITNILVRPAARGGKYLGPDAANAKNESAYVSLLNLSTKEFVDGYVNTLGKDPGPAGSIMSPVSRANPFATDPQTVGIKFALEITRPNDLLVTVKGPLSFPDQARTVQTEITILPGADIGENAYATNARMPAYPEGLVIEIPGLCISHVEPSFGPKTITCKARVTMMCGCPINDTPDWFWPPIDFSVQLVTFMASGAVYKYTLHFDTTKGVVSSFKGEWDNQAGSTDSIAQAWIFANEPKLGNQGKYLIPLR